MATLPGSSFEIDYNLAGGANFIVDTPGNKDWANAPGLASPLGVDIAASSSDNAFGQGTKEDTAVPTVVSGSIPPNKSNLTRYYVANEISGPSNHNFLYLAWERANILGSANIDFEFNQSQTVSSNNVTPLRTSGDVLITFDFTNGGGNPVLGMRRWQGNASSGSWSAMNDLTASGIAIGAVNSANQADPLNGGFTQPGLTFGEAAIDLSLIPNLFGDTCVTLGSAYVKSRSSASFSAEEKDFIAPVHVTISNCGSISGTKFNDLNGNHVFDGNEPVISGVTIFLDVNGNGVMDPAENTAAGKTVTATDGTYTIANLQANAYTVAETVPQSYDQTFPVAATPGAVVLGNGLVGHSVVVPAGVHKTGIDFGNRLQNKPADFGGLKFLDVNGNGAQQAGEPGVGNWTIQLWNDVDGNGVLNSNVDTLSTSVATDSSAGTLGQYRFTVDVTFGDTAKYIVHEVQQAGYVQTAPTSGDYAVVVSWLSGNAPTVTSNPLGPLGDSLGQVAPFNLDFGNFAVDARIQLGPASAVNAVGANHTITATVQQNLGAGFVNAPNGTVVVFSLANSNSAAATFVNDGVDSNGDGISGNDAVVVNGICSVQIVSASAGLVTINATTTFNVAGASLTRDTDPATASIPAGPGGTGPVTKTYVDASIALSPPSATNATTEPHTITATVKQNLGTGAGFVNAPNGTVIVFSLTNNNGATATFVDDGVDSNGDGITGNDAVIAGGVCSVQIVSASAGLVTINGTTTFNVAGESLTRDTNPATVTIPAGPGGTGPASKTYVDASIALSPPSATNATTEPHTITAAVKQNLGAGAGFVNAPNGTVVVFSMANSNGATAAFVDDGVDSNSDGISGNDAVIAGGVASVQIVSATAGLVTINATTTFTVAGESLTRDTNPATASIPAGPGGSGPVTKTYVDASIALSPPSATNATTEPHTITATVQQNLGAGAGFVNAPDGAVVVFSLANSNGATATFVSDGVDSNGDGNSGNDAVVTNGIASVQIVSAAAGLVTINATTTFTVAGESLTRDTSPATASIPAGPGGSGPVTKTYVDANIALSPLSATNSTTEPHTITATVRQNLGAGAGFVNAPNGTVVVFSLANSNGATAAFVNDGVDSNGDGISGNDAVIAGGVCSVQIVSATAGLVTINATTTFLVAGESLTRDTDPATASIPAGPGDTGPASKTYVAPNLAVVKTADAATVHLTPNVTNYAGFTIVVTNNGPGTAFNVNLDDALPDPDAKLAWYISDGSNSPISVAGCTVTADQTNSFGTGDYLHCAIGSLAGDPDGAGGAAGGSFSIHVSAVVPLNYFQSGSGGALGNTFEIDGDEIPNLGGIDWTSSSVTTSDKYGSKSDLSKSTNDDALGQGSSENDTQITIVTGSIPNSKADLTRSRFYSETIRDPVTLKDEVILDLAWNRATTSGSVNFDFEINQELTNFPTPPFKSFKVNLNRTVGDLLITYDFGGGSTVDLNYRTWNGSAWSGPTSLNAVANAAVSSNGLFGEASINLTKAGILLTDPSDPNYKLEAFSQAWVRSRASNSFTSEIKDIIAPVHVNINNRKSTTLPNTAYASADNNSSVSGSANIEITNVPADESSVTALAAVAAPAVTSAQVQVDPLDGRKMLVIDGTRGNDRFDITPGSSSGKVNVEVDGVWLGEFKAKSRILIYGQKGNDTIQVSPDVTTPCWLFGGKGNDQITGGGGNNVLVGGDGKDQITGGNERDLLIGGAQRDRLNGGANEDLIISGLTSFDTDQEALHAIWKEWTRTDKSFTRRIDHILSGIVDGNRSFALNRSTVWHDGKTDAVDPAINRDWFFVELGRDLLTTVGDSRIDSDLDLFEES